MNAAYLLTPKSKLVWMQSDFTLRQALEKMRHYGFNMMPVIDPNGKYLACVTEGDFLWHLIEDPKQELTAIPIQSAEDHKLEEILVPNRVPAVAITANMEQLMLHALKHTFVPVVDDTGSFIGIVTRTRILNYYYRNK